MEWCIVRNEVAHDKANDSKKRSTYGFVRLRILDRKKQISRSPIGS
jgi:hypothetical protein